MNSIHFFLTPDKSASRRLRRRIAEDAARIGVMVGTWGELISVLQQVYLQTEATDTWETNIHATAKEMHDAFWSKSLKVAEKETLSAISDALGSLLEGSVPGQSLSLDISKQLPVRAGRHLQDLIRLHAKSGYILPPALSAISTLLVTPKPSLSRQVAVYHQSDIQHLSLWQKALLKKISDDCSLQPDPDLVHFHRSAFEMSGEKSADNLLSHLQKNLFLATQKKAMRDESIQWVAARDYLAEVEVAAGMIQSALRRDPSLKYADIGILLPTAAEYSQAVRAVFSSSGLPVSALTHTTILRDIGRETVLHFLLSVRKPAPVMSLASLVTSPLMPWTLEKGRILATRIMNGDVDLDELQHFARHLTSESIDPAELNTALWSFSKFLTSSEEMAVHLGRARQTISSIRSLLQEEEVVPWEKILSVAAPEEFSGQVETIMTREGIAVFSEREEPWRQLRYLFILGFASGHYPKVTGLSSIFAESDLRIFNEEFGYSIETRTEIAQRRREQFRRQLMSASEKVTILMPRRDGMGESIHPSETLTFMAQLIEGVKSPDELVYDLDSAADLDRTDLLARAPESKPKYPRTLAAEDVTLPHNLLKMRVNKEGEQKPESPSGLETLMVSPLAWLLRRYNMEPKEWAPEELDMMGKGTLAHAVFEHLFAPGRSIPLESEIRDDVPSLLHNAITELMPFMLSPEWRVERRHLERDINEAALHWRAILTHLGATVIAVEVKLVGSLDGLPLTGNADLLLELPCGRMYVVDYKKSKSKDRRERMTKSYDSQANLYRVMLQTGGIDGSAEELTEAMKQTEIGAMYYLMNDQTALTDTSGWIKTGIGGVYEMGGGISVNAMEMIKERIAELEQGKIILNSATDEEWFKKNAGTKAYALDNSPLVRLFMKQA